MRVAAKFVVAMVLILVLIRAMEGVLTVQRESERLNAAIERDARLLQRMLTTSVRNVWLSHGRKGAMDLIDAMNLGSHPIRISWAPFEGEDGLAQRLEADSLAKLEAGDTVAKRRTDEDRGDVQYYFIPAGVAEAGGVIQLTERLEDRSRYVRHSLLREALAGGTVLLTSGAAVILLGIVVVGRPLSRLRQQIRRIGDGDLSKRLRLRGRDELAMLAEGLNEMCTRLAAARERERAEMEKRVAAVEQVRHMDRLTTIGRLASGIAHELGTPLNVISGRAGMICDGTVPAEPEAIRRTAETIREQAQRMTRIIEHLLDFARQRPPRRVRASGLDVVRQAVDLVDCLGHEAQIQIEAAGEPRDLFAEMDPVQIQQVLTNLLENALYAVGEHGEIRVGVESAAARPPVGVETQAERFLRVTVADDGMGIAEEDHGSIFDPFYTTKEVGKGTGLGLSITYGIIREHGGWIDVVSKLGEGSRFTFYIPQEQTT
ncbi:MAG: ATP-binding protein [Phycisphaeraceae bacterium]